MGNGCSILSIKHICYGEEVSIHDLKDNKNKNGNNNIIKESNNIEENSLKNEPNSFNSSNNNILTHNHSPAENKKSIINYKGKKLIAAQFNLLSNIDKEKCGG